MEGGGGPLTFMRSADHVGGDERHLAFVWKAVRLAQVHPFRGPLESVQHLLLYGRRRDSLKFMRSADNVGEHQRRLF
jgi:hypothetical protein